MLAASSHRVVCPVFIYPQLLNIILLEAPTDGRSFLVQLAEHSQHHTHADKQHDELSPLLAAAPPTAGPDNVKDQPKFTGIP